MLNHSPAIRLFLHDIQSLPRANSVAVAGITADANILVQNLRLEAQRYTYGYQEPIPIEQLVVRVCDTKQGYTQYGGMDVVFVYMAANRAVWLRLLR